jgi:hypothetical protein
MKLILNLATPVYMQTGEVLNSIAEARFGLDNDLVVAARKFKVAYSIFRDGGANPGGAFSQG